MLNSESLFSFISTRVPENDLTVVSGFKSLVHTPFTDELPTSSVDYFVRFFFFFFFFLLRLSQIIIMRPFIG